MDTKCLHAYISEDSTLAQSGSNGTLSGSIFSLYLSKFRCFLFHVICIKVEFYLDMFSLLFFLCINIQANVGTLYRLEIGLKIFILVMFYFYIKPIYCNCVANCSTNTVRCIYTCIEVQSRDQVHVS